MKIKFHIIPFLYFFFFFFTASSCLAVTYSNYTIYASAPTWRTGNWAPDHTANNSNPTGVGVSGEPAGCSTLSNAQILVLYGWDGSKWSGFANIQPSYCFDPAGVAFYNSLPVTSTVPTKSPYQTCPAGEPPGFYWPFYPGQVTSENTNAPQGCIVPSCTALETPSASNGACLAKTCPSGSTIQSDGTCKPNACPAGQVMWNDSCVASCSSSQTMINGVCEDNCPAGQTEVNGQCLAACASNQTRDIWGNCQNPCPDGQSLNNLGVCVANCPAGQEIVNGACASDCPSGQVHVNGQCVPACPSGQTYVGGNCQPQCPNGQTMDIYGVCQTNCPAGFTRNSSGNCVAIQCAAGQSMINGVCTPNPSAGTIDPSAPAETRSANSAVDNGSVTGGTTGVVGGVGGAGTTGTTATGTDPAIDNTPATCPVGSWCLGDGVCEPGEPSWSSDCAGPNYFEDRWQKLQNDLQNTGMAQLASLGNHQFTGGSNTYTVHFGQFGGDMTYSLDNLDFGFSILKVIFQCAFAWISIKIILLKKD